MKLAIDAGHWIDEPGRRCWKQFDPEEHREWWLNNRIVEKVVDILTKYDVEIVRTDDPTGETLVPLDVRRNTADDFGADLLLSVHHNGAIKGGSGGGTVVYTDTSKRDTISFSYAQALYNAVVSKTKLVGNRSAKVTTKSLAVCRSLCPSILIENGFMDSSTDVPIIITEEHADKTAEGIVDFLIEVFGIKEKNDNEPAKPVSIKTSVGVVNTNSGLNLRSTPTSVDSSNIIRKVPLPDKSFVLIFETLENGWCKVYDPDTCQYGYVFKKYLTIKTEKDFNRKIVDDITGLNIRKRSNIISDLVATMPNKATFMVVKPEGSWGLVWCGESLGYSNISDAYSKRV